jgi:hypothetical protein
VPVRVCGALASEGDVFRVGMVQPSALVAVCGGCGGCVAA